MRVPVAAVFLGQLRDVVFLVAAQIEVGTDDGNDWSQYHTYIIQESGKRVKETTNNHWNKGNDSGDDGNDPKRVLQLDVSEDVGKCRTGCQQVNGIGGHRSQNDNQQRNDPQPQPTGNRTWIGVVGIIGTRGNGDTDG